MTCRVPASPHRATIHDLTHDGCRVEIGNAVVEPGTTMFFELPDGTRISGQVVWSQFQTAGVRFERRLLSPEAIALGIEKAPEVVEIAPPEPTPEAAPLGLLHHWFRRLTGSYG